MRATADVTILTASMPERSGMLGELCASVAAQTVAPRAHLIAVDHPRDGFVATVNRLASQVTTTWLMVMCDDDLLDPHHLATITAAAGWFDVAYTWCRSTGRDGWTPNAEFDAATLRHRNFIPGGAALVRTSLWQELGGYRKTTDWDCAEDWDFWQRALEVGAEFVCEPKVTWTYRFHGQNLSLGQLPYECK